MLFKKKKKGKDEAKLVRRMLRQETVLMTRLGLCNRHSLFHTCSLFLSPVSQYTGISKVIPIVFLSCASKGAPTNTCFLCPLVTESDVFHAHR